MFPDGCTQPSRIGIDRCFSCEDYMKCFSRWQSPYASKVNIEKETTTIRQQFVMAAMNGFLREWNREIIIGADEIGEKAVMIADACLAEEARTRKP